MAKKKDGLTKRAQAIVIRMRANCETLHAEVSEEENAVTRGLGFRYWLEPSGKPCGPATARELIDKRAILPKNDGLMEGFDQSWCAL